MTDEVLDIENQPIVFNPPLYIQRYNEVIRICSEIRPKKVADFGCAECKLIQLLKRESYIEELYGVDINKSILEMSSLKIEPFSFDYINPRSNPLVIKLLEGSVLEHDIRLNNFEMILCIEIIEHLLATDVPIFTQNLFGSLQPNHAVISTPNADFNILFNFKPTQKYRHWDHKFEWTRFEFQSWCNAVCKEYGYNVKYIGIGEAPRNAKDFGCCTQMALFTKIPGNTASTFVGKDLYKVIAECIHPFKSDKDKLKEKIMFSFNQAVETIIQKCIKVLEENNLANQLSANNFNITKSQNNNRSIKKHFKISPGQFENIDPQKTENFQECNTYNHKIYAVVVLPLSSTYTFASRIQDFYVKPKLEYKDNMQFQDVIIEDCSKVYQTYNLTIENAVYKLCHSDINSSHDFENLLDSSTIYVNENKFKIPIQCIIQQEIIKDLPVNNEAIINCLKEKDMEKNNTRLTYDCKFVEVKRYCDNESVSSCTSKFSSSPEPSTYYCGMSDFNEENWDSD